MQEKWHSWFDYTWGIWICATWIACGWFRERRYDFSPDAVAADRWLLLGILFASLLPVLWYSLRFFSWTPVQRDPRLTWSRLVHALLGDSFVTCVLLATYGRWRRSAFAQSRLGTGPSCSDCCVIAFHIWPTQP